MPGLPDDPEHFLGFRWRHDNAMQPAPDSLLAIPATIMGVQSVERVPERGAGTLLRLNSLMASYGSFPLHSPHTLTESSDGLPA